MNLYRAKQLVQAVNRTCHAAMSLCDPPAAPDASLSELIEAKAIVKAHDDSDASLNPDGSRRLHVLPDDRLIAAAYAAWHHAPQSLGSVEPTCVTPDTTLLYVRTDELIQVAEEDAAGAAQGGDA